MLQFFILTFVCFSGVQCNYFDYYGFFSDEDVLKSLREPSPKQEYPPREVEGWPEQSLDVGQITAVSINSRGQPVIFHRAQRVFDETTFNESNVYQNIESGPIAEETILVLDQRTGSIVDGWGADRFYMPHGLTIDHHDNVWVTDIALHQVFKFHPHQTLAMTIGEAFRSGKPRERKVLLCMPTAVAVATTGEIFIADGYCNNHVLQLSSKGDLLRILPNPGEVTPFNVPHSLALVESLDVICIADRENRRIVTLRAYVNNTYLLPRTTKVIDNGNLGKVFAIAAHGDLLYVVNGPTDEATPIRGFVLDAINGHLKNVWNPSDGFTRPHSIAVSKNGTSIYVTEIGPNKIWKFELN